MFKIERAFADPSKKSALANKVALGIIAISDSLVVLMQIRDICHCMTGILVLSRSCSVI